MTIDYKGNSYVLATSLRVAYRLQQVHNHKPYTEIFSEFSKLTLERQIELLWISMEIGNPGVAELKEFTDYVLDNWGMDKLNEAIGNLMDEMLYYGLSPEAVAAKKAERAAEEAKESD